MEQKMQEQIEGGLYHQLEDAYKKLEKENEELKQRLEACQHETVVMGLLRELAIRGNYAFPQNEQEEVWFNEGIEQNMSDDFMERLFNTMTRYNHFSKQEFKVIRFVDLEIGDKFRKDFFNGNKRRKDIICVKTGKLTYIEKRSKKQRSYKLMGDNIVVKSYSERVG